ncbi:hypothetical protein FCOL_12455 [Flavobacterium columnare ATCC 49512]|uniref:Uncharacterized protein n=1 Tax=Flavobacterium columnare (strain ATCC 49512 / CIP 103533 / TG 44/87) TaxID=1041826 RepID=G8X9U2_FLACA|nr:hypothetical protein [Flavobacterium columnare]AEW87290.1 hypothetical protein FCOL_12455 [Flavobacterium columnare ATCC 49512]MBF6654747.1 hypothetical protein [Flavobacterium columnare]MBF6657406.1 hypothetical protein [Flavobacterium columnare]
MPIVQKAENIEIEYILKQSHNKFFEEFIPTRIPSRMYEIIKISTDGLSIKLIDKNQLDLLSVVHGNFNTYHNIEYFEIIGTYSKIERNGFLTYLFEILIYEFKYKILSDSQHSSPGSKEFWKSLIRKRKFNIYRLNIKTNFKRKANRFKEDEIWTEVRKDYFATFLNNHDYYIENDEVDINDNFEDSFDFTTDFEEVKEASIPNTKNKNSTMENIRLVAQKYVG